MALSPTPVLPPGPTRLPAATRHQEQRDLFMTERLSSAALLGTVILALAASYLIGHAKPPDLPQVERPVCAPQSPQCPAAPADATMTHPDLSPVLPQPYAIDESQGGQEESELRSAADRHAAMRRLTRCLLLGTHPLLPFLPLEECCEYGPDACDPGMVHPADRLLYGIGQPGENVLAPCVESLIR